MLIIRSLLASLVQVYTHISITLTSSLVTFCTFLPFFILVALLTLGVHAYAVIPVSILVFLGVLPYPGSAAGQVIARELATNDLVVTSDAWRGFEGLWQPALRAWLVGSAVTVGLIANVAFYTHLAEGSGSLQILGFVLSVIFIAALSLWVAMHLYVYPLLLVMERHELRLLYRNALILVAAYPVSSILGAFVWVAWVAISAATGVFLAGGFLVAATIQQNIFARLPIARQTETYIRG